MRTKGNSVNLRPDSSLVDMLVPIARMLLKRGVGTGEFIDAARSAYIVAATREITSVGKKINISQVAVATGLTRKEVSAALRSPTATIAYGGSMGKHHRAVRVARGWLADKRFHDTEGKPAPLSVDANGAFCSLVKLYAGDVTPLSVLHELAKLGLIAQQGNFIRLVRQTRSGMRERRALQLLTQHVRDLTTAVGSVSEESSDNNSAAFREIRDMTAPEAALFQRVFQQRISILMDSLDDWASSQRRLREKSAAHSRPRFRIALGSYVLADRISRDRAVSRTRPLRPL